MDSYTLVIEKYQEMVRDLQTELKFAMQELNIQRQSNLDKDNTINRLTTLLGRLDMKTDAKNTTKLEEKIKELKSLLYDSSKEIASLQNKLDSKIKMHEEENILRQLDTPIKKSILDPIDEVEIEAD